MYIFLILIFFEYVEVFFPQGQEHNLLRLEFTKCYYAVVAFNVYISIGID